VLASNSSSLTAGHSDRRDHVRCEQADRLVIHGVHCLDDEVLDSRLDQRAKVGDRSIGRGLEDVVAPRAFVALLDAFGK
jgi:hypothetical protein